MNTNKVEPRKLSVGVVGIGRMGRQHALNALNNVNTTKLVSVCSPASGDIEWANINLVPYGVKVYGDFEDMITQPGLEAVVIASTTTFHYQHVIGCIRKGLHVLCEKPLAMSVDEAQAIANLASESQYSHLKIMTGFSRRFDRSYQNAYRAIQEGRIGTPVVIRSETRDRFDDSDFYYRYIMSNPGIFIDTAVHDIDLTLMFLGDSTMPKSCQAIGTIALHKNVSKIDDVDNAVGIVEWYPPKRGDPSPISYYYFSRIMHHGFDNPTEIIGTEGALKINLHPHRDLMLTANRAGIGNDVMPDFYERYEKAFVTELEVFASCVLDNEILPYELEVTIKGMKVGAALQESLRRGVKITWDEAGNRTTSIKATKL